MQKIHRSNVTVFNKQVQFIRQHEINGVEMQNWIVTSNYSERADRRCKFHRLTKGENPQNESTAVISYLIFRPPAGYTELGSGWKASRHRWVPLGSRTTVCTINPQAGNEKKITSPKIVVAKHYVYVSLFIESPICGEKFSNVRVFQKIRMISEKWRHPRIERTRYSSKKAAAFSPRYKHRKFEKPNGSK